LPRSQLNEFQVKALGEMGGRVVIEDLRPYQNALNQLGAPILTLERLTNLMATAFASHEAGVSMRFLTRRSRGFIARCGASLTTCCQKAARNPARLNPSVHKLLGIPFVVTEDSYLVTISQSYIAQHPLRADQVASLLPRLAILSRHLLGFPKIARLVTSLGLAAVASHLEVGDREFRVCWRRDQHGKGAPAGSLQHLRRPGPPIVGGAFRVPNAAIPADLVVQQRAGKGRPGVTAREFQRPNGPGRSS
jgi:hypothetical protein